jgi:hypothetical protein
VKRKAAALAPVVFDSVTGGDGLVRKALERTLKDTLSDAGVDVARDAGYAVTLRVDDLKESGAELTLRCGLSIARLPGRNILGSLRARADVSGEGTDRAELVGDAAEACGKSLADDLTGWLRTHPL